MVLWFTTTSHIAVLIGIAVGALFRPLLSLTVAVYVGSLLVLLVVYSVVLTSTASTTVTSTVREGRDEYVEVSGPP